MIPFPEITEAQARSLISNGLAGYWELRLRDSIWKSPIAHSFQTAIHLDGHWYLVPAAHFAIKSLGRFTINSGASAEGSLVHCTNTSLCLAINEAMARLMKK